MGLFSLLFSYKGRINRLQYWMSSLGISFAGVFAIFAATMMAIPSASGGGAVLAEPASGAIKDTMTASSAAPGNVAAAALGLVLVIFVIWMVMAYCAMAIQVKRFHDRGQSGWLSALPMLPAMAIFYSLFTGAIAGQPPQAVFGAVQPWVLLLWAINIFFFINLGCLAGTPGPNKYGDPPGGGSYTPSTPAAPRSSERRSAPGIPGVTAKAQPAQSSFALGAAQDAIDRAAAQARAEAMRAAPVPAPAAATASGAPSFGRRVSR